MSNLAVELAESFDFECTGADDHDSPVCRKCGRLRTALTALLRRAGEGSQAAPPTLNIEVANLVAAVRLTVQHFKRSANSGNFLGDDEHECWTALENALKPVAAAAGSGTFAAPTKDEYRRTLDMLEANHRCPLTQGNPCSIHDWIAYQRLAQEKREPQETK